MRWRRVGAVVVAVAVGLAGLGHAADLREIGLRIDLTLQPLYAGDAVRWNFDLGGYALVVLAQGWGVRAAAGFNVLSAGPYLGIGLLKAIGSSTALEGDVRLQWTFGVGSPVTTAGAGIRFAGAADGLFYELAAFPVSWTLASVAGAPAALAFSPSFTVGGGSSLATGLEFGQAVTVTFLPASPGGRPVLPVRGWMLSPRLTSHVGLAMLPAP